MPCLCGTLFDLPLERHPHSFLNLTQISPRFPFSRIRANGPLTTPLHGVQSLRPLSRVALAWVHTSELVGPSCFAEHDPFSLSQGSWERNKVALHFWHKHIATITHFQLSYPSIHPPEYSQPVYFTIIEVVLSEVYVKILRYGVHWKITTVINW